MLDQPVAGLTSKELFMGLFGLSATPLEFGGRARNTFLWGFHSVGQLPSLSFSYTAGSYGRNRTPPSLVLGGYDATRLDPKTTLQLDIRNTSVADAYEFEVYISSIAIVSETNTEPSGYVEVDVPAYIYSVVPGVRLPLAVCKAFEDKLRLKWDELAKLDLLHPNEHNWLLETNPSIVVTISFSRNGKPGNRNFTLPFSAFDLRADYPLVENQTGYFPL